MNSPLQAMQNLLADDQRFKIDAYQFVRESLQYAHENIVESPESQLGGPQAELDDKAELDDLAGLDDLPGLDDKASLDETGQPRSRHVSGQQLCEACRLYALDQYGYLAQMVLASWGLESTSDFGELVYNLIRIEQMKKSENDRREDFDDVYDFAAAFEPIFEFIPKDDD